MTLQLLEAVTIGGTPDLYVEETFCRSLLLLSYPAEASSCNKSFDNSVTRVSHGRWLLFVGE